MIDKKTPLGFKFGSRVYGTADDKSDVDYIAIGATIDQETSATILGGKIDVHYLTNNTFQQMLDEHHIQALEIWFYSDNQKYLTNFNFKLDLSKLRESISKTSSNSWVKCKKKLKDGEFYIGQKSLFHSLRILMFGISIAKTGRIENYSCANMIYKDVVLGNKTNWTEIKTKYKPIYNNLKSEFKKWAPK